MELSKKKLEDLISAVDKIVAANSQQEPSLFDELSAPTDIAKILDVPIQDPEKSYDLYYGNIQKFLNSFLPKDNEISKPIRELVCILLSHKEKDKKGIRHGDSRQAKTTDMENLIEVLSEWSETPQDFIIRKSKFPQNPKRSVRFSGKRTKRSVQKRKARNTQKAETKVL